MELGDESQLALRQLLARALATGRDSVILGYIGIMEKKMETMGIIGIILGYIWNQLSCGAARLRNAWRRPKRLQTNSVCFFLVDMGGEPAVWCGPESAQCAGGAERVVGLQRVDHSACLAHLVAT